MASKTHFEQVQVHWRGDVDVGAVDLTPTHLVFAGSRGFSLGYPLIHSAELVRPPRATEATEEWTLLGAIRLRCHHFVFITLRIPDLRRLYDLFGALKQRVCLESLSELPAFSSEGPAAVGVYDARAEFRRMLGDGEPGTNWRFTESNAKFALCPTYPQVLVVPARISDTTLGYAARYRSKGRLPVLCYLHQNGASMTRSSQPMVGLKQARSLQDEKLVEAILATSQPNGVPPRWGKSARDNVIIDARPTTNAVVNRAIGAGSENMDHYRQCRKVYLGIDNIHVMRDALNRLVDAMDPWGLKLDADPDELARLQRGPKARWLGHMRNILEGVKVISETIHNGHHVLVHCSDGWDRTAQLTSLAQLCLDPYYRTMRGFFVLVEKEWVQFGHQFSLRCGHLGVAERFRISRQAAGRPAPDEGDDNAEESEPVPDDAGSMLGRWGSRAFKGVQSRISSAIQAASDNLDASDEDECDPFSSGYRELKASPRTEKRERETSPVFQQFLDGVYQLWVQNPTRFEFNEQWLLDLVYHLHSAQFGTFLANNMQERESLGLNQKAPSLWAWVREQMAQDPTLYHNDLFEADEPPRPQVLVPVPQHVQLWMALWAGQDPTLTSSPMASSTVDDLATEQVTVPDGELH